MTGSHNAQTLPDPDASDSELHRAISGLLATADIHIGGKRPWDIRLNAPGVIERAITKGNLGFGEAYMDGDWDVDRLDEFFYRLLSHRLNHHFKPRQQFIYFLSATLRNLQQGKRAWEVAKVHYDLGNDFYQAMLDPRMTYSCGYWKKADTLAAAQEAKLDLICRKLGLQAGMRVLDIGCGWGSFMGYAAEHYGVECVGLTVSQAQADWVQAHYAGLPIEIRLQDYRDLHGKYDRIASVGMFEHVGRKNHHEFLRIAANALTDDGLFLLHTIGKAKTTTVPDPWTGKYIFPNGDLPSIRQIADACEGRFIVEDLQNFGADYDKTLMAWHANFEAAWPRFRDTLGDRFHRMWRYYLLSCAGAFRARDLQLWQWVLAKKGVPGGYVRPSD
ncbi:cyclopropane fatty acyl phospholipid synthase [Marinobacter sp. X15-166B]|uniref:cyclopropane fatty acyl phospholipid synthase n=1 Tax=Marinobacter sp. X15-166B TaxID=1897620 RepID=UPI00085C6035|nr:cyclopropane fatty acyl phospholipid synthase [Marinobacter sp. X15-166B]OEY66996.1 cyclopropane-fatty-acyl-phospholipid synthase [Marinobacter sp. X15-166B]